MVEATADEVIQSIMDEFGLDRAQAELFSDLGAKSTQDIMDLLLENLKMFCDVGGLGPTLGMVSATTAALGCIKHLIMLIDEMGQDKDGRYKKFVRDQTVMLKQIIEAAQKYASTYDNAISSGQKVTPQLKADAEQLVKDQMAQGVPEAEARKNNWNVVIAIVDAGGDIDVRCDRSQLRQIAWNLVHNAVKHNGDAPLPIELQVIAADLDDAAALGLSRIDAAVSSRLATSGYTAPLDAAGTRAAVGLASANLDTQLGAIAGYIDTEVGTLQTTATAIKAKTDNLPAAPAATGDCLTAAGVRGAVGLASANLDTQLGTLATAAALSTVAGYVDTEIGTLQTTATAIKAKTDSLTFTVAGQLDANMLAVGSDTAALAGFKRAVLGNTLGTVGSASTTTSVVTSSLTPAAAVADQFKGRILTFAQDTITAALRGQATDITASTDAGVLTVTALTTAPVSGDTFAIT